MIFGETGCYPVDIEIKSRLLIFWYRLRVDAITVPCDKISSQLLLLCTRQYDVTAFKPAWLHFVKTSLDNLGLSFLWNCPAVSVNQFKGMIKQRLRDQYAQTWRSTVDESGLCCYYRLFKQNYVFKQYLSSLPFLLRQPLLKFR
jgi:hypothetical protein